MCFVDVFASELVEESNGWKKICQKAYMFDNANFVDSGYPISNALVPTPSNKRKLRSSQESPMKTVPNPRLSDSHELSSDDNIKEADEEQEEVQSKQDMGNLGMETPVKKSLELQGSSASSMLPPLSHTLGSLSLSGRAQKKKKIDTITSVMKRMAEFQKQTAEAMETMRRAMDAAQKQTEVALAQMRAFAQMSTWPMHKCTKQTWSGCGWNQT